MELRKGSPAQLDVLAQELAQAGAEPGRRPAEALPRARPRRRRGSHSTDAVRGPASRLREQLREIERHDPGTRLGRDPESLHDMRVAVRRLRALLRAGKELVATDTDELDARLKELGRVLGDVRDLDVLLERLDSEAAGLAGRTRSRLGRCSPPCAASAPAPPPAAHRAPLRRYLALLDDTARTIEELEPSGSEASLDELAGKAFGKVRKAVRELPDEPADEELHAVRKKGKRARYAAELAGPEEVREAGEEAAGRPRRAPGRGRRRRAAAGARRRRAAGAGARGRPPHRARGGAPRGGAGGVAEGVEEARARRSDRRPRRGRIVVRDGEVLLVHRPKYDDWTLPEGQVRRRRVRRGVRPARGRGGDRA